jgi:hypothetical protein
MNTKNNDFICKFGPFLMLGLMFVLLKKFLQLRVENFDFTPRACERGSQSCAPCDGAPEGKCIDSGIRGWENSISTDYSAPQFPGGKADGRCRIFKKKNYYGYGPAQPYSYGEPFYERCEKY